MSEYIIFRLVDGETIMARLMAETPDSIIVEDPISIRVIQVNTPEGVIEKTVTNPLCTFTNEKEFSFMKSHTLFIKPVHPVVSLFYLKIVRAFDTEFNDITSQLNDPYDSSLSSSIEPEEEEESFLVIPDKHQLH